MAEEGKKLTVKDVDKIIHTISAKCELVGEVSKESKYTIFRVPDHICRGREDLFRPQMLSIGPYYHGREDLREMQRIKLQFLRELIGQKSSFLKAAVERLKDWEDAARNCYFHEVRLDRHEFVEMLLLDGIFIILFLIKWKDSKLGDVCGNSWWNFGMIMHDLFLLENQIPFFVVQALFDLIGPAGGYLDRLAVEFLMQEEPSLVRRYISRPNSTENIHHLLHLCYLCYTKPSTFPPVNKPIHTVPIDAAARLVEAGVTFRKKTPTDGFLDAIDFRHGVLSIPSMSVHEEMMHRLANVVALEQCVADVGTDVTSYAMFMDFLIDTPDDVEILRRGGVIGKLMANNKEVADFFNQLPAYAVTNSHSQHLADVLMEIDRYCRASRHEYRARLMQDYFSNPWASISFVAAAVLLVLTFVQTVMSFFSYYQEKGENSHSSNRA